MKNESAARWLFHTSRQNQAKIVAHLLDRPAIREQFENSIGKISHFHILEQGWYNVVLKVTSDNGRWIVRLRPIRENTAPEFHFGKEKAILKLLHSDIPVPSLPDNAVGLVNLGASRGSAAYLIQEYVPGIQIDKDIEIEKRSDIFRKLGEVAKRLHTHDIAGYGASWDCKQNKFLSSSWRDCITSYIETYETVQTHEEWNEHRAGITSAFERIESLSYWNGNPSLYHKDFVYNWSNIIFDEKFNITSLIDWETAGSGPAFAIDATSLLYPAIRDGLSPQQVITDFEDYLTGYGLSWFECLEHHQEELQSLLALQGVKALYRYHQFKESGGLFKQPWRRTFTKRALCMLDSLHEGAFGDLQSWAA